MAKRQYKWIPDLPDQRDYVYQPVLKVRQLPKKVDLRWQCSPVEDQGNLGSCTAQAFAGVLEYLANVQHGSYVDLSRLFIYYNERKLRGVEDLDAGAYLRDGIKALKQWGVCAETAWPYDISKFKIKPPDDAYQDAQKRTISIYQRLSGLMDVRLCLAEGFPVVFGFSVYESFEQPQVDTTGFVPLPKRWERMLGGHAALLVGYDSIREVVIFRNSYSNRWGDFGYGYLPYEYILNEDLVADFWVIKDRVSLTSTSISPDIRLPDDSVYIPFLSIIDFFRKILKYP